MTAQGGDLLAWLDRAISFREQAARGADQGEWTPEPDSYEDWEAAVASASAPGGHVANCQPEEARHIAANSPASVLRRCAADRKLISQHGPCSDTDWGCKGCGFDNQEESMVDDYNSCPVLIAIAEGYGWTEGER